jgi:hypothetical protein
VTFEQILLLYLYQHKKLSINLFGTIELQGQIPDADVLRKEKLLPVEGIHFQYDTTVKTDTEFIKFYASEKGKIYPLAESDIEMQLIQAKQIVNIGNPFDIPGIGKIVKKDDGKLTLLPGYYIIPPNPGSGRPVPLRERANAPVLPKGEALNESRKELSQKQKQWIVLTGMGVIVIVAIWAFITYVWPLVSTNNTPEKVEVVQVDTLESTNPVIDSIPQTDSLVNIIDSLAIREWKASISTAGTKQAAEERLKKYISYGHNAFLETRDSNNYIIYVKFSSAGVDTAQKRDSLARFFGFPVKVEPWR